MTQKEIKAAESLLRNYQRRADRCEPVEYNAGKIKSVIDLLESCGCTACM